MNDEHVLKGAFEGTKFVPGKHKEYYAAPTKDPTVVRAHLNKRHECDLAPVSRENKLCTSQQTRITIVELVQSIDGLLLTKFR